MRHVSRVSNHPNVQSVVFSSQKVNYFSAQKKSSCQRFGVSRTEFKLNAVVSHS